MMNNFMELIKNNEQLIKDLKITYQKGNILSLPKIKFVTVYVGTGKIKDEKDALEKVISLIKKITSQHPIGVRAKKSIAAFKVRKGQIIGFKATLRNKRAFDFLNKLFHSTIPRIRDFRGLDLSAVNKNCFNIGIKDSIVFPELGYDQEVANQGVQITVTLSNANSDQTRRVIEMLGGRFKE